MMDQQYHNPQQDRQYFRCRYCRLYFIPEPRIVRKGRRVTQYIECPRCGNGDEMRYRKGGRWNKPRGGQPS